jgi:flagellar biosynthesis GTPase FlhF
MQLKRYQAQTVKDALSVVREGLGPDALVPTTRPVAAPGPKGSFSSRLVELTAAATRPSAPVDRHSTHDRELSPARTTKEMTARRRGASARAICATLAEQLAPLAVDEAASLAAVSWIRDRHVPVSSSPWRVRQQSSGSTHASVFPRDARPSATGVFLAKELCAWAS